MAEGPDIRVSGAERFASLARALQAVGRGDLVKELERALKVAVRPVTPASRALARARLPQRGGLADKVARAPQRVTARTSPRSASLRVTIAGKKSGAAGADRGKVRHPVFGRRQFVEQSVPPGWFTDAVNAEKPQIRDTVVDVLDEYTERIARGV